MVRYTDQRHPCCDHKVVESEVMSHCNVSKVGNCYVHVSAIINVTCLISVHLMGTTCLSVCLFLCLLVHCVFQLKVCAYVC